MQVRYVTCVDDTDLEGLLELGHVYRLISFPMAGTVQIELPNGTAGVFDASRFQETVLQ